MHLQLQWLAAATAAKAEVETSRATGPRMWDPFPCVVLGCKGIHFSQRCLFLSWQLKSQYANSKIILMSFTLSE